MSCKLTLTRPNIAVKSVKYRKFHSIDDAVFRNDLLSWADSLSAIDDLQTLVTSYNSQLINIIDKHAPERQKTIVERPKVPWFSDTLRDHKRKYRHCERVWRTKRSAASLQQLRRACNYYQHLVRKAKSDYMSESVLNCGSDQGKLYKLINTWFGKCQSPEYPKHDSVRTLVENFADYFSEKN